MMSRASLPARCSQRGLAAVEFAIALPVLLLLMMATAELGRMLSQYDTVTKAVRDGARYLAGHALVGSTSVVTISGQLQGETVNLVVSGNVNGGPPLVPGFVAGNVTVANLGNGYVSVAAAYTYQPILATLPTFVFTNAINLALPPQASVVMRAL